MDGYYNTYNLTCFDFYPFCKTCTHQSHLTPYVFNDECRTFSVEVLL